MLSRLCNEYCVPHSCAQLHRSVWQCAPWPGPKYTTAWKTCFWETANKLIDGIQYHWWKKSRVLQIAKSWDWLVKWNVTKGVASFLYTNDTIPCKRCAGNQPARETGMAQLPHGFSLLQQHAPFAFSPFLTSQPSQSLRFPMNVSSVPCRIGQQWRWNCELFELFESKEKFGLGAMSRGAHIPGFSPFYSNRLAARNLPSFNWIHWLNSLLASIQALHISFLASHLHWTGVQFAMLVMIFYELGSRWWASASFFGRRRDVGWAKGGAVECK